MNLDLNNFKETVNKEEVMYLATSSNNQVTLRPVSPLLIEDVKTIYFYTSYNSNKYKQMKENGNVALNIGPMGSYQAEGTVRFLGGIFEDKNKDIRDAYKQKYIGAFENPAPGEDMQSNEFIALDIKVLKGWIFEGENPVGFGEERF